MKKTKGLLIVISGPSGVGKSTVRKRLIEENPNYWYSISMTTRKPRLVSKNGKMEEEGKDYYFVTEESFKENIKNNNFFEYAEVYKGLYYGTPKNKVLEMLDKGYNVVLEIDVQGALLIKKQYSEAILIFINPPSIEELERRLTNRKTDKEEDIKERIEKAKFEISFAKQYDYVVLSGTNDEDYQKILKIIKDKEKSSR